MPTQLLVQSCSATKSGDENPVKALDRYDGYFYKIIKKARSEGRLDPSFDICVLSAEHGLLDIEDPIRDYDRQMDRQRAVELRPDVIGDLRDRILDGEYDRVVLNLGKEYRRAVEGFAAGLTVDVEYISGDGIGEKGHQLKRLLRTDESTRMEA